MDFVVERRQEGWEVRLEDTLLRVLIGGVVVSTFALLGDVLKPKSFAGIFGAAPSVALAMLALTVSKQSDDRQAKIRGRVWRASTLQRSHRKPQVTGVRHCRLERPASHPIGIGASFGKRSLDGRGREQLLVPQEPPAHYSTAILVEQHNVPDEGDKSE